jgi:hypothetical protein
MLSKIGCSKRVKIIESSEPRTKKYKDSFQFHKDSGIYRLCVSRTAHHASCKSDEPSHEK